MPIKDMFSYSARWDSVGLDCAFCKHQINDKEWPNLKRDYACGLHKIPLRAQLQNNGYKEGEWFCKDFENNGRAFSKSIEEFTNSQNQLKENILYGCYGKDDYLKEIPFNELENYK